MSKLSVDPITLLNRHVSGDWGDIHSEDRGENERALEIGARIFSVYGTEESRLWVITEADRAVTTILLSEEY
jgi:hypothetical protein